MLSSYTTFVATLASLALWANALPLNINLGAYSPALVVGDGEISFAGGSDVNSLMAALEGAAVETAAGVAAQGAEVVPAQDVNAQNEQREEAKDIAKFLGGKENDLEPRKANIIPAKVTSIAKRALAGFDRALTFAEAALVKGPKVQLGTGEGGSGIGIIVDNNQVAAARPGTGVEPEGEAGAGAETPVIPEAIVPSAPATVLSAAVPTSSAPAPAKRDIQPQKQRRAKMTTMYIRSGVPGGALAGKHVARELSRETIAKRDTEKTVIFSKRDNSEAGIDSVNLNVPADGITMTFVEEVDESEE